MIKTMEDVHPNLYFKVYKEEIRKEIDEKLKEIDEPIVNIDVYRKCAPIISKFQVEKNMKNIRDGELNQLGDLLIQYIYMRVIILR